MDFEDSIKQYFTDIKTVGNRVGKLSKEDELDLARRVKSGDESAVKILVEANLRFVIVIAKKYQNQGLTFNDLISEGNIGLIKAAHKYDDEQNVKFISYAVWWIRQSIMQALNEKSRMVRNPTNKVHLMQKVKKKREKFISENDREPTPDEVFADGEIAYLPWWLYSQPTSLNNTINEDGDELCDVVENKGVEVIDEFDINNGSLTERLDLVLSKSVTPRESMVLKKYYGLCGVPMTLQAIGDEMTPKSITKERVRQIRNKALQKIRAYSGDDILQLKEFLS